jgi:hypothetical protein
MNLQSRLKGHGAGGALLAGMLRSAEALQKSQQGLYPIEVPADGRFTTEEFKIATISRMTGPRSSRPSFRAITKTIRRMRRGGDITKGGWRSWPSV